MELFLSSIFFQFTCSVVRKYYTARVVLNEELLYSTKVDSAVLHKAVKVVGNNPHKPTLVEILGGPDHKGSLQTAVQCFAKCFIREFYNSLWTNRKTTHKREYVVMHDGGTVALDWVVRNQNDSLCDYANRPIVLFLPGTAGDAQSEYLYFLADKLLHEGFLPVVLVLRGCGDLKLTSASYSVSKLADDIFQIIHLLKEHEELGNVSSHNSRKIFMVGYSLGAGGLLNYLGQADDHIINEHIQAAVSVCPPWIHASTADTYKTSCMGAFWNYLVVLIAKLFCLKHFPTLAKLDPEFLGKVPPIWEFISTFNLRDVDRLLLKTYDHGQVLHKPIEVSRSNGFTTIRRVASMNTLAVESKDDTKRPARIMREVHQQKIYHDNVDDFYADISPINFVHRINATPTLVLISKDDPICPHTTVMNGENFGRTLVAVKTDFGGHLAFPIRNSFTASWSDQIVLDWFRAFL